MVKRSNIYNQMFNAKHNYLLVDDSHWRILSSTWTFYGPDCPAGRKSTVGLNIFSSCYSCEMIMALILMLLLVTVMVVDVHVDHNHDLFMMCFYSLPLQMNFHSYLFSKIPSSPTFPDPSPELQPRCQELIYTTLKANVFYPCTVQIFLLLAPGDGFSGCFFLRLPKAEGSTGCVSSKVDGEKGTNKLTVTH